MNLSVIFMIEKTHYVSFNENIFVACDEHTLGQPSTNHGHSIGSSFVPLLKGQRKQCQFYSTHGYMSFIMYVQGWISQRV